MGVESRLPGKSAPGLAVFQPFLQPCTEAAAKRVRFPGVLCPLKCVFSRSGSAVAGEFVYSLRQPRIPARVLAVPESKGDFPPVSRHLWPGKSFGSFSASLSGITASLFCISTTHGHKKRAFSSVRTSGQSEHRVHLAPPGTRRQVHNRRPDLESHLSLL